MFTGVISKKVDLNYNIDTIEEKIPSFYGAKNSIDSAFVIKQSYFYYSMVANVRLKKFKE